MKTLLAVVMVSGCAMSSSGVVDDLAGESQTDADVSGKADGAADGVYTYFQVQTEASGWRLARLNRSTTVCTNGASHSLCHVPQLDWSEANLSVGLQAKFLGAAAPSQGVHAIARGRMASNRFVVTEAWVSETGTVAEGVFAKVTDSGVRCITTPCPTMREHSLNNSYTANIAEIDWSYAGLSEHEVDGFNEEIISQHGTIIAGDRYNVSHTAKARTATAAFHKLADPKQCFRGGCSNQLCGEAPQVSSCIYKPEYACYQAATCELQPDDTCGFTADDALTSCLAGFGL
ncbi:hypothetical protein BH11MYX1_BH11MYX1_54840 [soil metagenome]